MRSAIGTALLCLAGCTAPIGNRTDSSANAVSTNRPAPGAAPAPAPVSPFVGRWADSAPECARPIEIFSNGTVRASDGSRGHWRYEGNRLTFNLGSRTFNFTIVSMTRDRVVLIDGNGQRGESIRCS